MLEKGLKFIKTPVTNENKIRQQLLLNCSTTIKNITLGTNSAHTPAFEQLWRKTEERMPYIILTLNTPIRPASWKTTTKHQRTQGLWPRHHNSAAFQGIRCCDIWSTSRDNERIDQTMQISLVMENGAGNTSFQNNNELSKENYRPVTVYRP